MKSEIKVGLLYSYVHFVTEIVCFYYLSKIITGYSLIYVMPFVYDGLAFMPQSLIGYLNDKYPKIKIGLIGTGLLFIAMILFILNVPWYYSLITLCMGNALTHVSGAEKTLRIANGKLAPSAIFVAGGSFGVITGKLLAKAQVSPYIILFIIATTIPFILLANYYNNGDNTCKNFNYHSLKIKPGYIVILMALIVMARGYIGYGIPTSWNKSTFETIMLFVTMGIGKALGGILSDKFGIRKVGIYSTILAIPFLCFGDNYMLISLIGVLFFSMTMAITLGVLVSVLKNTPGLAFGLTTIGLFLGTAFIFFIKVEGLLLNCILIFIISIICSYIFSKVLRKDDKI